MAWLVTPAEAGCCMVVPHKSCLRVLSLFPGLCAVQRLMSESLMHLMHNPGSALSSGQSGPLETHRRTPGKPLHDEHAPHSHSLGPCAAPGTPQRRIAGRRRLRSEEHTSELQSQSNLVCRLLLEKKKRDDRMLANMMPDTGI